MPFDFMMKEYDFKSEDIYMLLKTDFEFIKISTVDNTHYLLERNDLIRFISSEFEENEYKQDDFNIHAVYFLPSHKEKELCQYLSEEVIVQGLEKYYTEEMMESFDVDESSVEMSSIVQYRDRHRYGTSFFGVEDDVELVELIKTASDILELKAMNGYKIAIGGVSGHLGLLERGRKVQTENPQSKHYSLWKFCESKTGKRFADVGNGFRIMSQGG
ncbi:hypothetical protein [Cohnella sp. GbtcB17]|uniref:hypothetical protein n=1 Tax=Cohnella sp. GbtcB17 TaxID=2824762 RepID=UPI001C3051E0|nr:hypothetical protein [Cohnella sp. GbtcB17]